MNFNIFNHTSEKMTEVRDSSVDIVIFAPPYNIGTPYNDKDIDRKDFFEFKSFLGRIMKESARVLKPGGLVLVEAADSVYFQGKFIALSDLIQKIALECGMNVLARHINFLQSDNGVVLTDKEHNWSPDYYSEEESHSNCHQWLILKKGVVDFNESIGKVFYLNYPSNEEGHPCPFSYQHVITFLELTNFEKGMVVLEPFMGTGRLGEEVVKRGGYYYGYEIAPKHFLTAQRRLSKTTTC